MKIALVEKIETKQRSPDLKKISVALDKLGKKYNIDLINWEQYNYNPKVDFAIAYSSNEIFIKYYISEYYFKAEKEGINKKVHEDSCVEFFVSPENDGIYYNFEFNGIGACTMGSGTLRENNMHANPAIVSAIRILPTAGNKPVEERKGVFEWSVTVAIPFKVFFLHRIVNPGKKSFRANFYKCGDKLSVPHYLTWSPVLTRIPDFHQPQYFGLLRFV